MKKQMKIIIFTLIILLIGIGAFFLFRNNEAENYPEIKIIYSDLSVSMNEKNLTIKDKEKIKKISNMCKNFESGKNDNVSTSIINNYIVTLGDEATLYMDSTVYNYGYIKYKGSEKLEFVKLPDGLLEYIKEIVANS